MIYLIVILVICIIVFIKILKLNNGALHENASIILYEGAPRSGKSFRSTYSAVKEYKSRYWKWFFSKRKDIQPLLYSNIPIFYKLKFKKHQSVDLRIEHLLELEPIREKSVIHIDEAGDIFSQHSWQNPLLQDRLNKCIRYGGHSGDWMWFLTDQSVDAINIDVRRKIGNVFYMNGLRFKLFGLLYILESFPIFAPNSGISTVLQIGQRDYKPPYFFGFNSRFKRYDSRAYKHRYKPPLNEKIIQLSKMVPIEFPYNQRIIDLYKAYSGKVPTDEIIKVLGVK